MPLELHRFELGPCGTNGWVLVDPERQEAILVDAPPGITRILGNLLTNNGCRLTDLLLTHGHWDHIAEARVVRDSGVKTWGHRDDTLLFEQPEVMAFSMPEDIIIPPVEIDTWLQDGQQLEILGRSLEVRHVPGHCPGNLLFWFPEENLAFPGDAIFRGSIGRYDFPGGSFESLQRSIREKVYTLPPATRLCPGHGPETTPALEMRTNPYVRAL